MFELASLCSFGENAVHGVINTIPMATMAMHYVGYSPDGGVYRNAFTTRVFYLLPQVDNLSEVQCPSFVFLRVSVKLK